MLPLTDSGLKKIQSDTDRSPYRKVLYFVLFLPLASMIMLIELHTQVLIFLFLGYASALIGFFISKAFLKRDYLLSQEDKLYRLLARHVSELVVIQRVSDGKNVLVSQSVERVLGYLPTEIICQYGTFFVHADDQNLFQIKVRQTPAKKEKPTQAIIRILKKDGYFIWAEVMIKAIYSEKGMAEWLIFSFRDISEKKEIEDATRKFAEELSRRKPPIVVSSSASQL